MKTTMEIARAQIQQPGKGEDSYVVRSVGELGSDQLLAVADGLSMNAGKAAASWVIDYLGGVGDVQNPRRMYRALQRALAEERDTHEESETTLTCGILRQICTDGEEFLRFEYFAIGDSPIWKVVSGPQGSKFPFQRVIIHGSPYPAETAQVYATLRLHRRDIQGMVTFGQVDIGLGEVLVVCTDGIPEREIFVRDLGNLREAGEEPKLCPWLFQQSPYCDKGLCAVLDKYNSRGVLYDDATIIVARLGPVAAPQDAERFSVSTDVHSAEVNVGSNSERAGSFDLHSCGRAPADADSEQPQNVAQNEERTASGNSVGTGALCEDSEQAAKSSPSETLTSDASGEVSAGIPRRRALNCSEEIESSTEDGLSAGDSGSPNPDPGTLLPSGTPKSQSETAVAERSEQKESKE